MFFGNFLTLTQSSSSLLLLLFLITIYFKPRRYTCVTISRNILYLI